MRNKTVIITGGARGIGAACSELFAEKGYNTVICYNKSKEAAKALAERLGSKANILTVCADVRKKEDTERLAKLAAERFGKIDALICNAGIADKQRLFSDTSREDWDKIFETDLFGVFNATQAVLPFMINKKSGSIVNISSVWGERGASCEVIYSSAKAAVLGFTKSLAKELAPSGIRVNAVSPGVIDTDMNAHLSAEDKESLKEEIPLCRFGSGKDVAKAVYFLASDEAEYITGQSIITDGGFLG